MESVYPFVHLCGFFAKLCVTTLPSKLIITQNLLKNGIRLSFGVPLRHYMGIYFNLHA
jgi:hypothetical protein